MVGGWERKNRCHLNNKASNLSSIVEAGGVLERSPLALAVSFVTACKDEGGDTEAQQHGELAGDCGPDTRYVPWEVLLAIDSCGKDTPNTPSSSDDSSEDRTLGVASDVVGAVGKNSGNATKGTGIDEEKAKVSGTVIVSVAGDEETDENDDVLHSEPESTLFLVLSEMVAKMKVLMAAKM
jgi:hypothetical protein